MKIVLLHALPLDERMWEPQREVLGDADVFAPRLYGYGNAMDAWADGILRDAGQGDLALVGASMGGYAALAVARRAPGRVRGLLLEGARTDADSDERRRGRADTIRQIEEEGAAGLWRTMAPKLLTERASPDVVAAAEAMAVEQDPLDLVHAVEAIRDRDDLTGVALALRGVDSATPTIRARGSSARPSEPTGRAAHGRARISKPLVAAVGSEDPFVSADELREAIGEEHVREIVGAGHLPSLERPDEFNPLLSDFLDSLS